ncbi:MAG: indolepyruvate ferredoxin oxidoreductase family protein [Vulcanimicrobiaceae bacterium]
MISPPRTQVRRSLDDRYALASGTLYLSGIQALIRLPIDQHRRDVASGLNTRTFVTGYPGSPLGGYDISMRAAGAIIGENGITHVPAQSEELGVTMLMGTQMLDDHPRRDGIEGVVGIWYGKGPGIDRSGDALRHGNFGGTSRLGAVVVLGGEDPESKSSTLPFQEDYAFMSAGIPIVYPSSVAEFLEYGLHAIALSRYSGCWVAMKLIGQLCDGGETFAVSPDFPKIIIPELTIDGEPFRKYTDFRFFPGLNIDPERRLYRERHLAVRAYTRANQLDRVAVRTPNDRIGLLSAGKSFSDLRQALLDLGFNDDALRAAGIRLGRLGVIYPADEAFLRDFAEGLDEIIVVEEKRGVVETALKAALCNLERRVRVVGKDDEHDAPLFPVESGMDADIIARILAPRLGKRAETLAAIGNRTYKELPKRTPNYCSGCPHNTSTVLLDDQIAWGSPGCHSFASIIEQPQRHIEAMTQLGGEGMPWIGLAPYTSRTHMVQNVGDGSLFHSSYMNIRFAISTDVNITFKILFNGAVANTGAQAPVGGKSVEELVALLALEGVRRIVVLTQTPESYRRTQFPAVAQVCDVDELEAASRELRETPGVTVLIYDGTCANERRRRQKRGKAATRTRFVVVNEDVCENCGDCGALTNCMSLGKVETEFGIKTQIHQSSCNQDQSCIKAECPSFVTFEAEPGTGINKPKARPIDVALPEPNYPRTLARPYHIYSPGVGGTGVLTLNAILAQAAAFDGKRVLSYDQTGAAQKWGAVLSSLIVAEPEHDVAANRIGAGKADLYLALDLLAAADPVNLDRCDPENTTAVINTSLLPSGEMIRDVHFSVTPLLLVEAVRAVTRKDNDVRLAARAIAEGAFGDHMMTNLVTLGAAYQSGLIPVSAASIEHAIRLNGVAVEDNLLAFDYGRLAVYDSAALFAQIGAQQPLADRLDGARETDASRRLMQSCDDLDAEAQRLMRVRIADLCAYQSAAYAARYVNAVLRVAERERALSGKDGPLTRTVIRSLHKLLAYKDEYEVARLYVDGAFSTRSRALFTSPRKMWYNLHPPILRSLGLKRKVRLGSWFTPVLRVLASAKVVRGTPWDIFGYAKVRRVERELIVWYEETVASVLARVSESNLAASQEILEIPDSIRGYEDVKLGNVTRAQFRAQELLAKLS